MRWLAAAALVCALAPAVAEARPRAAILFIPYAGDDHALLAEFAERDGMAIGLTSPTVGGFKARQMALDMGQGARIPTRLYSKRIGRLRLAGHHVFAGDRIEDWNIARRRAEKAPADLVPGLLASTIRGAGSQVAYAGLWRSPGFGAIVAADEHGFIGRASIASSDAFSLSAVRAWRDAALLVADLPRGQAGLQALDRLLGARGADDVVFVVRAPGGSRTRLLPSGLAAPGVHGRLRSATTRTTGLIAATDVAPTVLADLGLRVPDEMDGEPIVGRGAPDVAALEDLGDRLQVVSGRRQPCLIWFGAVWLGLIALFTLVGRRPGTRAALRAGFLAALWVPGIALLNAELAPGRLTEAIVFSAGSFALALLSDRALPWPVAPVLPAGTVFIAHAVDLARGSPLIARSVAGPNPAGGARFFGVGNELEVLLAVSVLVGTGAGLAWLARHRETAGPAPAGFAVAAAVAAIVMGAGRLGADVGAVITLGAGAAAAILAVRSAPLSPRSLALALAAPVAALALLILIDVVSGGGAHLTRSVLQEHGSGDVGDVLTRRLRAAVSPLGHPGKAAVFATSVAMLAWLGLRRERLLDSLARVPGRSEFRAGLVGAFAAVVVSALANDSATLIAEIGAVVLTLAAAYAYFGPGFPQKGRSPAGADTMPRCA